MNFIPKSQVPGIIWPAIGDQASALAMSLQYQLQNNEWLEPKQTLKAQLSQASALISHAYARNSFYQEYYRQLSFRPKKILTAENWSTIPIIKRRDIQKAGSKLVSQQVPEYHGAAFNISTSGSTGQQIDVQGNQVTRLFWNAFGLRDHLWHQRNLQGMLCVIKKANKGQGEPPNGSDGRQWGSATNIYHTGPSALLDVSATLEQQIDWLERHQPQYLLTYPSNFVALSRIVKERNIHFPSLLEIRTLGEIVNHQTRQVCKEIWKLPLTDVYSCQEAGYLAMQCPDHEHYHVMSEGILLEVLDDNDQACLPGQIGRVVITSLHNYATPLIRYEIGDYAEVGEPCPCGRSLPVLKRIQGRVRNMLVHPNGNQHWPIIGSAFYRDIADIQQFQLIQTELNVIEVHLVVGELLTQGQETALTKIIHQALAYPYNLTFNFHEEIPRSAGGKYEDFISRLI